MARETPPFVHLHVHTEYSMLDGLNRIPALVSKIKDSGMNSVALTDHGVMYGAYEFWKACKEAEIKPIIGAEIYVAPTDRKLRSEVNGIKYYHLILLAKNFEGYNNLIKLVSIGHLEGFYYRPRVDREILEKYSKGIICSSGCPVGPLGRHIVRGEEDKAKEWLEFLHSIYKDDFYLEIQRHGFSGGDVLPPRDPDLSDDQYELAKEEVKINAKIKEWSKLYKIPLIASCDAHYLNEEDELSQEIAFAIKDGKTLEDADRRHAYKRSYIKTPEEIFEEFSDVPEAIENTQKLADKVEIYDIIYNRVQPKFPDLPKGATAEEYLKKEVYSGVKKRYGKMTGELKERVDMELKIIHDKGYDDYFLVVSDMMKWARKHGVLVGVRGSVAGSVASYCLDISDIEPIRWELYFERFLNPERKSPPDIDMDLQDSRREEVINYVIEKYGRKNIAAIAAFGRLKTRAAIRDVCRVMKIDLKTADILSKMVHVKFGRVKPMALMLQDDQDFRKIIEGDPRLIQMADTVSRIEGLCRHVSTHACGYLITPDPITDYVRSEEHT